MLLHNHHDWQMHLAVNGEWHLPSQSRTLIDPWNGEEFMQIPDPQANEIAPFVESLRRVGKTGLHNPLKNPERHVPCPCICFRMRCLH